jgi:hypothetical protein
MEAVLDLFQVLSRNLTGRANDDYGNLNIAALRSEILTRNIPNTTQESNYSAATCGDII